MNTVHAPSHATPAERRAVLIGGSLDGLLAARVLSEYFDDVLLLERDPLQLAIECELRRRVRAGRYVRERPFIRRPAWAGPAPADSGCVHRSTRTELGLFPLAG